METKEKKTITKLSTWWIVFVFILIIDLTTNLIPTQYTSSVPFFNIASFQLSDAIPSELLTFMGSTGIFTGNSPILWLTFEILGMLSIIGLYLIISRKQQRGNYLSLGFLPIISVVVILSVKISTVLLWIAFVCGLYTLFHTLKLLGILRKMRAGFKIITKVQLLNVYFWLATSTLLVLDVVLKAIPTYVIHHTPRQLSWVAFSILGALSISGLLINISQPLNRKIMKLFGVAPLVFLVIAAISGSPYTESSMWIWFALATSIGTAVTTLNIYGKIENLLNVVRNISLFFWGLTTIMFSLDAGLIAFPKFRFVPLGIVNFQGSGLRFWQFALRRYHIPTLGVTFNPTPYLIWGLMSLFAAITILTAIWPFIFKEKKKIFPALAVLPFALGLTGFIFARPSTQDSVWMWLGLAFSLFTLLFAYIYQGNINNLQRKIKNWGKTWKVYSKNWMGMAGLIILFGLVVIAILGPNITPYGSHDRVGGQNEPPSSEFILGTNKFGEDMFTVLLDSLRISMLVGIVAGSLTVIIGTTVGVASAYVGGWLDNAIMRLTDVILVLPALPLMLLLASLPGMKPHWTIIAFIYVIVFWPVSARLIRGQALSLKQRAFVISAKANGAGNAYIIRKHLLPNVFPLMLTMIITSMRQAILYEAFLAYLGLGDPWNWSLGLMLRKAQDQYAFALGYWWMIYPPAIAIAFITLSFAFIGIAFDEIVNPRLRKR